MQIEAMSNMNPTLQRQDPIGPLNGLGFFFSRVVVGRFELRFLAFLYLKAHIEKMAATIGSLSATD
jgi:hypothetical protein